MYRISYLLQRCWITERATLAATQIQPPYDLAAGTQMHFQILTLE